MNRYQFEDLISEYIENELSLSKRKEFEAYLETHPDAKNLVESITKTREEMNSFPIRKVFPGFNKRLMAKIEKNRIPVGHAIPSQKTIFGFSPIHASMMTGLAIAFVFVSVQLFSPKSNAGLTQTQYLASDPSPPLSNPKILPVNNQDPDLADIKKDSTDNEKQKANKDYSKQIQLVND